MRLHHLKQVKMLICLKTNEASQKAEVANMLQTFKDIFESMSKPIDAVEHKIDTGEHKAIASAP